jgi:hypothetical protein
MVWTEKGSTFTKAMGSKGSSMPAKFHLSVVIVASIGVIIQVRRPDEHGWMLLRGRALRFHQLKGVVRGRAGQVDGTVDLFDFGSGGCRAGIVLLGGCSHILAVATYT